MDRPNLFVIARFLRRLEEHPEGVSRSRLQAMVRVNYDIFRRYLDILEERGHVTVEDGGTATVRITEAGRQAHARLLEALREWLDHPGI